MVPTPRHQALRNISNNTVAPERPPSLTLTELFGSHVFNDAVQRKRLTPEVYQSLRCTIDRGLVLEERVAAEVADAMKDWAVEHGATHFTHWFQPMTGLTAEKHDSFLSPVVDGGAIHAFSGKELIMGEPDASSFPSGGIRATFEARGYTAWDPTSPAFLRETAFGVTLCIPTAFCSWTGEALDTKTPLLRSCEALDRCACRLLGLIGEEVERIHATMGPEQEYFLIDRDLHRLRPDLIACGRTLFGARPPKGQELEDHYFATTPERILNFMMDLEQGAWKLGIPLRTRHNEVAPHQFEMAPRYEKVQLATDHNMLLMELLETVAERHGLACLLHEKPFAGVNGSGKHNNWSLADENDRNLLDPGHTPHENMRFFVLLTALIRAVDRHQDLLRASVATAGNDHRLGANEAPPAIMSISLGSELEEIVEAFVQGSDARSHSRSHLELGVTTLPPLPKDTSDRNRTSPFAFTGDKFELRTAGSSQTIAYPNMVINTIVAESMDYLSDQIEQRSTAQAGTETRKIVQDLVKETLKQHHRILFSGDNYAGEWTREAERRGLLNLRSTPDALEQWGADKNIALFEHYGVLSRRETVSRSNVFFAGYVHRIRVESLATMQIASTSILPAGIEYQKRIAESINAARTASAAMDLVEQEKLLIDVGDTVNRLRIGLRSLDERHRQCEELESDPVTTARMVRDRVLPVMEKVRAQADHLEEIVDDALWVLPKYHELLFLH